MLTKQDQDWLNHLSDTNLVKIIPYSPKVKEIFRKQKQELRRLLGQRVSILHRGATSLGISGKGDVDIYIPVPKEQFDNFFQRLRLLLKEPGSIYPYERVRWNKMMDGFEVEIFLVNQSHSGWIRGVIFEDYLKIHPEALDQYRKLKENASGLSTREYYRRKIEFINEVLTKVDTN